VALRNQLGELYVKVIADVSSAIADSEKLLEAYKNQTEGLKKQGEAAKKVHEEIAKRAKINVKDRDRILKDRKLDKVISKEKIKEIDKEIKAREKAAKKVDILLDRHRVYNDLVQKHLANKLTKFRDYSGRVDEQEAATFNKYQQQKLADYESFLHRASSEHSRFVTRLDQRDMTASTIENMRRGFEKGVISGAKWHKDENQIQRTARGIGMAAGSLRKMKDDSEMAMAAFQSFQRVTYAMQSALGVLGGTIGSLGGGLLTLVGVAGQAAYSLVAVGSAFASMGAGMISAKIALGGVGEAVSAMLDPQNKLQGALRNTRRELRNLRFEAEEAALSEEEAAISLERAREELARVQDLPPDSRVRREAELQFQQAELAYRRAKARNKEAREDLKKGPTGGGAIADPLAKLTESQKDFAKYLVTLKPKMDELKEAAASGFLPILQTAIQTLVNKAFPTLESGLNILGTAMGNASKSFADAFTTPENLKLLDEFFKSSKPVIEAFGRAAGSAFGGILGVLKAAQPLTTRFTKWVESSAKSFENWGKSDGLESFLTLAGDVAASLGSVFRSVFGGLKNLLEATFPGGNVNAGAGGIMLQWLQKLADGFKAFTGNAEFAGWLQESTRNATTALSSIGALLKPLFDIAARPEIGQFWTILRGAAEPIKKMLEDGAKAGPEFAAMLVSVAKLIAAFSDSGALEAFFNTLKRISDILVAAFDNPVVKMFLDVIGRIHGVFLAIGLAIIVFKSVFMVIAGITKTVFLTVGKTAAVMDAMTARGYTVATQFDTLRRSGLGAWGATKQLGAEIYAMNRAAKATREASKMLQMAKDAGMAKKQVKELRDKIDEVIIAQQKLGFKGKFDNKFLMNEAIGMMGPPINPKTGKPYGKNTKTAQAYQASLQQTAQGVVGDGSGGYQPKYARNRLMTGARAVAGVGGAAAMLGSMGSSVPSALTTTLGGISAVTAMIPGPIGLLASAATGIGAAISSGFDAAAQAERDKSDAEKQRKIEIQAKLVEMTAQNVDTQQNTNDALLGAGATGTQLQDIIKSATSKIEDAAIKGVTDPKKAFETLATGGFADTFTKGTATQQKKLIADIEQYMSATTSSYEEAISALAPIYEQGGRGGKGVQAITKYIKDKELDKTRTVIDPKTGEPLTLPLAEANAKEAEWAARDKKAADLGTTSTSIGALKSALSSDGGVKDSAAYKFDTRKLIANQDVYKALGITKEQFDKTYRYAGDPTKTLDKDKKDDLTTALTQALIGAQSKYNSLLAPPVNPNAPKSPYVPRGAMVPDLPTYIPPTPGAPAAPVGPTGKTGDPLNVSDPELKKLGPVLTKLANATPNVVVVNVKNKSELDSLYKKLGLPSGT